MAAIRGTPPQWKIQMVEDLKRILTSYPTIAIVGFRGVPATQMQDIRRKFRGKALIKVIKNTLLEKAIEALGDKYEKLKDYIYDQTAIVATNMNPFKLYKMLEETKVPSPLKPGQVSPVDVVVEKGPTPFPPGPIIGELQAAGLPAAIERGKVVIKETVTVVRAGEVVKPELARVLEKLDIKPIKIGLDVRAIYDNGIILTPDVLAIDPEKVIEDISKAYQNAINLALNIAYVTKETAELLTMKAVMEAKNLAINACILEKGIMPDLLAKAYSQMLALASMLPDEALDDDLKKRLSGVKVIKEEVEEKKEEEKKDEEEEKEEKSEEEALEGLGALFG